MATFDGSVKGCSSVRGWAPNIQTTKEHNGYNNSGCITPDANSR